MPKFNIQGRTVGAPGVQRGPRADAQTFGGDGGLQQLGQGISSASSTLLKLKENNDRFDARQRAIDEKLEFSNQVEQLVLETPDEQAQGLAEKVDNMIAERQAQILEDFSGKTTGARDILQAELTDTRNRLVQRARGAEIKAVGRHRAAQTEKTVNKLANRVAANPEFLSNSLAEIDSLIADMPLPDESMRSELSSMAEERLYDAGLNGFVRNTIDSGTHMDIQKAVADLKSDDNVFKKNIDPNKYQSALGRLENASVRKKAQESYEYELGLQDWAQKLEETGVDDGGFTAAEIKANIDSPKKAELLIRKAKTLRASAAARSELQNLSFPEIQKNLQEGIGALSSTPAGPDFERLSAANKAKIRAFNQMRKEYAADPAAYLIKANEDIARLSENYLSNPSPESFSDYANAIVAENDRINPGSTPTLVPKARAEQFKVQMQKVTSDPEGAGNAVDMLMAEAQNAGEHWPIVAADLQRQKAITAPQMVVAQMVDDPNGFDRVLAEQILSASARDKNEIAKSLGLEPAEVKDIRQEALSELSDFSATLTAMPNGPEIVNQYADAIFLGVLEQRRSDSSASVSDVARKVINDRYEFLGEVRVPKNKYKDTIRSGMSTVMDRLGELEFASLPAANNLPPEVVKQRYVDSILRDGGFTTMGNDKGVELTDSKGMVVEIIGEDGTARPAQWTWDELDGINVGRDELEGDLMDGLTGEDISRGLSF